ncbi:voltage-gated potassium channel [Thermococcus sp. 18S1]|uniref:pentapeptide repeat-containing protein n=1 Tax=Thermococcus sp. 18S1 TaxID=1638210 RepID=UPI00143C2498|nr:pentapeptide repeat-containing protein [Thermococcus sp. 18S1]NJE31483.1 voltage-gated potassium channel [Thermococcus sp. 18S1]
MKCVHSYRHNPIKECPREAEEDSAFCPFHEPIGGKDFERADLSSEDLEEAYLSGANLRKANLEGSNLRYADLSDADLTHANLSWALLNSADLSGASLSHASLSNSRLDGSDLTGARLISADLSLASLENATLANADLRGAELYGANLNGANLFNTDFRGAKLYGVSLAGAKNLRYAKFDRVVVEEVMGDRLVREGRYAEAAESYNRAIDVYLLLKKLFTEQGIYDMASMYSVGEWRVRGKIQRLAHRVPGRYVEAFVPLTARFGKRWLTFLEGHLRWLANRFLWYTSSYGESPGRVFLTTVAVILLYAFVYTLLGAVSGAAGFWENLYFSVVTFTTVGYGDYVPKPGYHLLAVSEAFLGAFMMAFFVVVLSRKVIK